VPESQPSGSLQVVGLFDAGPLGGVVTATKEFDVVQE
jgi:hypothetical protein